MGVESLGGWENPSLSGAVVRWAEFLDLTAT